MGQRIICAAAVVILATAARGAEHGVSSAAGIARVLAELRPGDVVVMTDGQWKDQAIAFKARGTAEMPITLRAQTPGKVVLSGDSSLEIDGEHVVVSGLSFEDGTGTKDGVAIKGRNCRLTECAVVGGSYKFFARLWGWENRVDHCYFAEKTSESPTMQVEAEGKPNGHVIDHNHFGHRPPLGKNGGETIRVGYSHQSMSDSGTTVESNLFDRCDGEIEIISSKSCANVYRWNTFRDCAGMLTLRHGNRCRVEGNFFLGGGKRGSGGIRVIGEGHLIVNNYIERVAQGGIWVTSGIVDSELKGYFQARDCVIAFNTIVESRGPCIELDAGIGTSRRTLRPANIAIANNVFSPGEGGSLFKGMEGEGFKWMGNMASLDDARVRRVESKLARGRDGLLRPLSASPPIGAAEGQFASVKLDIDGQERTGKWDVGCDQASDAPVKNRVLSAADVGPQWMAPSERSGRP
jgi:poly(beta-D-mannuronate) lyase